MRIRFTPEARSEIEEAARWYRERAGSRVRNLLRGELTQARKLLLEQPEMGTPGVADTRKITLHRFPYSIVYRITGDELRVLAFMHHKRRPGYWRVRR